MKDNEVQTSIRIPKDMHTNIRTLAFNSNLSINKIVLEALTKFMYQEESEPIVFYDSTYIRAEKGVKS